MAPAAKLDLKVPAFPFPKSLFPRLILQRGVACGEYERSWVTMPLKDYKEVNVCFMTSDGTKLCSMDEIPELHIDSVPIADEDQKMLVALREPVELSFSFDMPVPPRELIFAMCVRCTWEQIQQNNWRKLHGFPMKRNKHGRHV